MKANSLTDISYHIIKKLQTKHSRNTSALPFTYKYSINNSTKNCPKQRKTNADSVLLVAEWLDEASALPRNTTLLILPPPVPERLLLLCFATTVETFNPTVFQIKTTEREPTYSTTVIENKSRKVSFNLLWDFHLIGLMGLKPFHRLDCWHQRILSKNVKGWR